MKSENEQIIENLLKTDLKNINNLSMLFDMARNIEKENLKFSIFLYKKIRDISSKLTRIDDSFLKLYNNNLKKLARYNFDAFMLYMEKNRPANERFYLPRRKVLKKLVDAIQMLEDDELDELFLNMPPRVGKTSILSFMMAWQIGLHPEHSNLYSAYSDTITASFYNGVLELMTDPTYLYSEIFPENRIVGTNSRDETIDVNRRKKYKSLTCRSLYGTLNGACDCNGFLTSDDLISGIEEALNKDRLISAWSKVDNNFIPRAKMSAKVLWCGTRWSNIDPAGIRMRLLESDEKYTDTRYKIIILPALNEKNESNFNYDYGVGFDTSYYLKRMASFERNNDIASWLAQYQQEPIERDGTLFNISDMNFYNGILPNEEPQAILCACDVAWGGGDYVSLPVAYVYDDGVYIADVVYSNGDKYTTRPKVVNMILKHNCKSALFESNNGGEEYREWVENELFQKYKYRLNIKSQSAPTVKRKEQRIYEKSPEIKEFYFLESGKRSSEYEKFMQNVFSFKLNGKNKNDDSVDSLAILVDEINKRFSKSVRILGKDFRKQFKI